MLLSLDLNPDEVAALEAKRVSPQEPLDVVVRRLVITPLVSRLLKERRAAEIALLVARYDAADPVSRSTAVETLVRGDRTKPIEERER